MRDRTILAVEVKNESRGKFASSGDGCQLRWRMDVGGHEKRSRIKESLLRAFVGRRGLERSVLVNLRLKSRRSSTFGGLEFETGWRQGGVQENGTTSGRKATC